MIIAPFALEKYIKQPKTSLKFVEIKYITDKEGTMMNKRTDYFDNLTLTVMTVQQVG